MPKTKEAAFCLILMISVVSSPWAADPMVVHAQQEGLDTTLARATAKGFLTTLTRPDLADLVDFYLLDGIQGDSLLVGREDTTSYEVTEADWISDVTYRVQATLQPGHQEIIVYTGKHGGRWLVEGIDLPTAPAVAVEAASPGVITAGDGIAPVPNNGPGKLVFQTQSGGDVYVINANGTGLQRITYGIDPQLSPDGTEVAFTRWEPRYELFTINVDGSREKAWTHGWREMKSPTWTAGGSRLVFSWQDGGRLEAERHRINLERAARRGEEVKVPAEARDVKIENGILTYTIPPDAYWHLKQVDLDGGQLTDLPAERHSYGPTAHPTQGSLLAYKGIGGIALFNLDLGRDDPVSRDPRDHTPVISPDGSRVAVSYWQDGHWEIHTMNIDGSSRQRLTNTPLSVLADCTELVSKFVDGKERFVTGENPYWNNTAPVWSPDGRQIAFLTDRTRQWEIWLMNAGGTDQRPMFPNGALDGVDLNYDGVDERMLSWR